MGWLRKQGARHTCNKPLYHECTPVESGDLWQCDVCGAKYEVIKVYYTEAAIPISWVRLVD